VLERFLSASDGNKTNLSKVGYTNLEMYLNELAGDFKSSTRFADRINLESGTSQR
jgi:hypothetical protein